MSTLRSAAQRAARSRASLNTTTLARRQCQRSRSYAIQSTPRDHETKDQKRMSDAVPDGSIAAMLATPSWSVLSLLPPKNQTNAPPPISSKQLHHLLRLSALPPPSSREKEQSMMDTLAAQLHFVKEMQKVDTTGIEPLRAIRDETKAAEKEQEVTLDTLKDALAQEEVVGKFYKRIRRKMETMKPERQPKGWDPLSQAKRTSGKFFVVDSGKGNGE